METTQTKAPKTKKQVNVTELSSVFETPYRTYSSTDYSIFKLLAGNRTTNQTHIMRLKKSFAEKGHLFSPILVNENMEIIDGQHRFFASQALGKPVYFIIVEGYGLEQVQILNTNAVNWGNKDYLQAYVDLGYPAYKQFKQFMQDFPELNFQACERLLTQSLSNKSERVSGKVSKLRSFAEGDLQIPDIERSYELAHLLERFKPYYKGYHRGTFVSAFMQQVNKPEYDHEEMIYKLKLQPSTSTDCINVQQYKDLLDTIFNYKRRIKVDLRH